MMRLLMALGISLCTAGCNTIMASADVTYVHSPNALPAPGTVFVEVPANDPKYSINAGEVYAWLGMYGYQKAPSAADATYNLRVAGKPPYQVCSYQTVGTDANGNDETALVCDMAFVPELDISMWRGDRIDFARDVPFVEIAAQTGDLHYSSTTLSNLLEFAFAVFPGVESTHQVYLLRKVDSLVCVETTFPLFRRIIYHCREPGAPAGVLANAPSS